jgi:signal transduction histidine kinase
MSDWRWSDPFNGGVMSADGHPHRMEAAIQRRDGSSILVSAAVTLSQFHGSPRWVVVFQNVTTKRRLERELIEVASREQERIGRDLHDGLGQELTGIALMLGGLGSRLQRELPAARADVEEIMGLVAQAVQSTRTLARGLSPVAVERAGMVSALRDLAARSRELLGLNVRVRAVVHPGASMDAAAGTQLYRVAQEALTNVVRHSGAANATLSFKLSERVIALSITDDGKGITPEELAGSGLGLKIIAYRARMIGGTATCERRPRGGTRVMVRVNRPDSSVNPTVTA